MKVKISRKELNECIVNAVSRVLSEGKTKKDGFAKSMKKGSRDAEREYRGDGFKSYDKVHKTQKDYSRKGKNKFNMDALDEAAIDFTVPGDEEFDDGYDMSEIPDINDVVGNSEVYSGEENNVPTITIKTDIDQVERDLINDILNEFEDAEFDVVDDMVAFNIPSNSKRKYISYLKENDVQIMK